MKKIIFLLMLLYFSNAHAQQLVEKNKIWSVAMFSTGHLVDKLVSCYSVKIDEDTIIGDKDYQKLLISDDSLQINWKRYNRCLRQEGNIVYCYPLPTGEEYILYNFGLAKSDSFFVKRLNVYIHVDSVNVINSLKYFYISYRTYQTIWIENIGCLDDPMESSGNMSMVGGYSTLLCCKLDNEIEYKNSQYNTCYLSTTGIAPVKEKKNNIFIYPLGNKIIQLECDSKGELSFFNTIGCLVKKVAVVQSKTTICLPEPDIVIYRFTTLKGEVQTGKIVVK